MDHICRKLRLGPGDRMLDVGCGWGALIMHAVAHYGVVGHGITLSAAQADLARRRIAEAGLSDRCTVEVRDYRDLPAGAQYDKISSVGVTEHVAKGAQPAYFRALYEALAPGGLLLNHCMVSVGRARPRSLRQHVLDRLWRRDAFIDKYVFPDALIVPAAHVIASAESIGFELRDVESLRDHYTMTLRTWVRRLEARREDAVSSVGERTYRVWRLYMAASAHGFATGRINIVHSLLLKPYTDGSSGLPLTREALYSEACPVGPGDVVLPSRASPGEPRRGRQVVREH
jgi:cyclopropane-fatty-acyl-phospholipid synthase